MPQYSPLFSLSSLNGVNGFGVSGVNAHDRLGSALASAGDVNGDGFADIIFGVPLGNAVGGTDPGVSYVLFGAASGWSATYDLTALSGSNGFSLIGIAHGDEAGFSVSGGDVNGDGFSDLIIGAWNANRSGNTGAGDTYVVFGAAAGFSGSIDLSSLNGANGFRLVGVDGDDNSGRSVAFAGDVNGDGYGDIIIGASQAESVVDAAYDNGHSYVVFGGADGWAASISLATLDGSNGFRIDGYYGDQWSGYTVAGGGDINGDGYDDLLVGSVQGGVSFSGETYVIFGAAGARDAVVSLQDLDGDNGFVVPGILNGGFTSRTLSIVGDVNGDGYDDFFIGGAGSADPDGRLNAGETYLVFGAASGWPASFNLASLNGANGFRLIGVDIQDGAAVVGSAGDFNGDGFADLIVGALGGEATGDVNYGETYVVFGAASGFTATFDLASIDGNNGFRIDGLDLNDESGSAVAGVGDVNGDGIDDIIIGANNAYTSGGTAFSGEAYVVFGARPGEAVTRTGTALDNRIFGGAFADTLIGLGGDDRLDGGGGDDAIVGGVGIDTSVHYAVSTATSWHRNIDGTYTVTSGVDGTETLTTVEILDFTDRDVVLDNAQQTFLGNGTSDLLWRHTTNGAIVYWDVTGATQNSATIAGGAGAEWMLEGVGDQR